MYKIIGLIALLLIGSALAETRKPSAGSVHIKRITKKIDDNVGKLDWCPQCVNTFDDLIELVLDAVLQYGILNSCGDLCDIVADKSGSGFLGFVCMVGCDVFGIEEFVKLMDKADIDPIYYCESIKLCPIKDDGDAKIQYFSIVPQRAPIYSTLAISFTFRSFNGTGTGEIIVNIDTVDKLPLSTSFLLEAQQPGIYGEHLSLDASPDPDCDPVQDQCEQWLPGRYNVTVTICNGQCGSHHPHTQLYDQARSYFDLYEQ